MASYLDWYGKICSWICSSPYSTPEVRDVIQDDFCSAGLSANALTEKDEPIAKEQRLSQLPDVGDSMLFQAALPELLPFTDFISLRAVSKQYSKISAFDELLRVRFPKEMLRVGQSECVSVYDLEERFPSKAKVKAGVDRRRREWSKDWPLPSSKEPEKYKTVVGRGFGRGGEHFCCPSHRFTYTSPSFCGHIVEGRGFTNRYDESFEGLKRQQFYQMRQRDGNSVVKWCQNFFWGLGNIELCCLRQCGHEVENSFLHGVVDSRCCIPAKYDEGEYVIPHYYDESTWM